MLSFLALLVSVAPVLGGQDTMDSSKVQERFKLGRMQAPTFLEIELQKKLQSHRTLRRYAVTAGVSLSVLVGFYGLSCMSQALEEQKQLGTVWVPAGSICLQKQQDDINYSSLPINAILRAIKNVKDSSVECGKRFSKFFADSATMMIAGVLSTAVYQNLSQKMAQAYQDETLMWFVDQQTKIHVILADLKQRTAEYDLHGALLSQEMLGQDTQIHLKAFIGEISDAASDYKHNSVMRDYDYFAYLLGEVKKKYLKKADSLEQMQEQLAPLIAHRHRAIAELESANLFDRDAQSRADIAELSRQLLFEMSKLVAFIEIHKHKHQGRVQDLIVSFNRFLEHVEMMLASSPEQVAAMSKENRGIFTVVFEYERMLDQQIQFLDKYCKIVKA